MTKKTLTTIIVMLCGVVGLLLHSQVAHAQSMDFSVEPQKSSLQRDQSKTYFDLNVMPGQKESVMVKVTNTSDKRIKINTSVNVAKTNPNGVVEYGKSRFKSDKTLTTPITDVVTTALKQLSLAPKSSKMAIFEIDAPKQKFNGVIAAGISFKKVAPDKKKTSKGISVTNNYQYVVGMVLHQGRQKLTPMLKLGDVKAKSEAGRNLVTAQLRNVKKRYLSQAKIVAKVQTTRKRTLYKSTKDHVQFAPNSIMDYPIRLNGERFKPGRYRLDLTVTAAKKKWHFVREFTITKEQAEKYNNQDVTLKPDHTMIYWAVGSVLIIIIGVLSWVVIKMKRKR